MTLSTVTEYLCHKWPWICSTCRKHSMVLSPFMICHRVKRLLPLVEQEMLTLPEHLSFTPLVSGVRLARSSVLFAMLCRSLFVLLSIVLSVLIQFTNLNFPLYLQSLIVMYILLVLLKRSYYLSSFLHVRYYKR